MSNVTREKLEEFYQGLVQMQREGRLSKEGEMLIDAVNKGSIAPAELGTILQGATFSAGDEFTGALRNFLPSIMGPQDAAITQALNEEYGPANQFSQQDIATELERRPLRQFSEDNPVSALGLETLGGFATGGPMGATRSVGKNLALAGGSGGLSGFMAGEGDATDRLSSGAIGTVAGLTTQGGIDLLSGPLAQAYKALFQSSNRRMKKDGRELAKKYLIDAIESEGLSVEEAIQRVAALEGKNYSLADLNQNTQALTDAISVLPGPGKIQANNFLNQRRLGRSARIEGFLEEAFGNEASFYKDFQAVKSARGVAAEKLYESANKKLIPYDNELQRMMQNPVMQDAYRKGMRIAAIKGETDGVNFRLTDQGQIINDKGDLVNGVPTQFLHYLKMGIDDVAFPKMPQEGIGATEVMATRDFRKGFLDWLDNANPAYKTARNTYAGDTAVMNAMETGRDFLRTKDTDELLATLRQMNPSELEGFRLGALNAYQDQLDISPETANVAFNLFKTPRKKELLRLSFPPNEKGQKDFDIFYDNLLRESQMHVTERAGMNSATQQRRELTSMMRNDIALSTDIPRDMNQIIFNNLRERSAVGQDTALIEMSNELAKMMTEVDPVRLKRIQEELLGGGDLLTVVKRNAPEFMDKVLPFIGQGLTRAPLVGNIVGGNTATADPFEARGLNQQQQRLLTP